MVDEHIGDDVAEAEFNRFLDANEIDGNVEEMTAEDRSSFEEQKGKLIKAIKSGRLVVNDAGLPVYTPRDTNQPLTFHEPTGTTFMALDLYKPGQDIHKQFAAMEAMAHAHKGRFANMPNRDLRVCLAIVAFFLAG